MDKTDCNRRHLRLGAAMLLATIVATMPAHAAEPGLSLARSDSQALQAAEQHCAAGDATTCRSVGEAYETSGLVSDNQTAAQFLALGCNHNDATSCYLLGDLVPPLGRAGGSLPAITAADAYQRGCTGRVWNACMDGAAFIQYTSGDAATAASMRRAGQAGLTADLDQPVRACRGGDGAACESAAKIIEGQIPPHSTKLPSLAADDLRSKACTAGDDSACYRVHGESAQSFMALWDKSCSAGVRQTCLILSNKAALGVGTQKPDFAKVVAYYRAACDERWPGFCDADVVLHFDDTGCRASYSNCDPAVSRPLSEPSRIAAAIAVEEAACAHSIAMACLNVGNALLQDPSSPDRARRLARVLEAACDLGLAEGCQQAAWIHGDADSALHALRDVRLQSSFTLQACRLGSRMYCHFYVSEFAPKVALMPWAQF